LVCRFAVSRVAMLRLAPDADEHGMHSHVFCSPEACI
jgi:hypothetical protein